jgi:translation initiation factor 2 beta subunit (eIF-2beta)/eIF-5
MSREWNHYEISCKSCGAVGSVDMWSDDWNRWGADMQGFKGRVYVTGPKSDMLECEKCGAESPSVERAPRQLQ